MKKEVFIEKALTKHGNKYDYSLVVDTKNIKDKYQIICNIHGIFSMRGDAHLSGQGCGKCGNSVLATREDFITKANIIFNNFYDYTEVIYVNCKNKVSIGCPIHGKILISPDNHLSGHGCSRCAFDKNAKLKIEVKTKDFEINSIKVHGCRYDYGNFKYTGARIKSSITCLKHGDFLQTPNDHLMGRGCPKCKQSRGETKIALYLDQNKIKYIQEYKFIDCKYITYLPFDFYLPELNTCIEFDGKQHHKIDEFFGGEEAFELRQKRDEIKNKYCLDNNINLIRIKYNEDINNKLKILCHNQ